MGKSFLTQYSNVPLFHYSILYHHSITPVNPPFPPFTKGGQGGLEFGCITQIGLDHLGVILDDLRGTLCDLFPEIQNHNSL